MEVNGDNPTEIRDNALRLLARREHSRSELLRKLTRRGWSREQVELAIDALAEEDLQSDQRFAESFARIRAGKHYGPMRIRAELAERGIDRGLADRAVRGLDVDWPAVAAAWYERRYGSEPVDEWKEKARRQQVLTRRGFLHEHFRELFD